MTPTARTTTQTVHLVQLDLDQSQAQELLTLLRALQRSDIDRALYEHGWEFADRANAARHEVARALSTVVIPARRSM